MRELAAAFLFLSSLCAHGESCPQLEGTFHCRSAEPFELAITQEIQNNHMSYTFSDPTGDQIFLVDGKFHKMNFDRGIGVYKAECYSDNLLIEAHSPEGDLFNDRYYIQRAALVRVRLSREQPSALSCAPTKGTWKLYPH